MITSECFCLFSDALNDVSSIWPDTYLAMRLIAKSELAIVPIFDVASGFGLLQVKAYFLSLESSDKQSRLTNNVFPPLAMSLETNRRRDQTEIYMCRQVSGGACWVRLLFIAHHWPDHWREWVFLPNGPTLDSLTISLAVGLPLSLARCDNLLTVIRHPLVSIYGSLLVDDALHLPASYLKLLLTIKVAHAERDSKKIWFSRPYLVRLSYFIFSVHQGTGSIVLTPFMCLFRLSLTCK